LQPLRELAIEMKLIPAKRLLKHMHRTEDCALMGMNIIGIKDLSVYTVATTVLLDLEKNT
jgi:hypothetical protein